MNPDKFVEGITAHPYITIILCAVVQGRLTAFAVGPFIALGYVNPCIAYLILVVMDFLGDTLYFMIGRLSQWTGRFLINKRWREKLSRFQGKTDHVLLRLLLLGKVTGVASKPAIVSAGIARIPLHKFYLVTVPCSLLMLALYMAVGYFPAWFVR